MRTRNEVLLGLRCQTETEEERLSCSACPYNDVDECGMTVMLDAIRYVEMVEDKIPSSWKESVMESFMKGE